MKILDLKTSFKEYGLLSVKALFWGEDDEIENYVKDVIKHTETHHKNLHLYQPNTVGVTQSKISNNDLYVSELSFETKVVLK